MRAFFRVDCESVVPMKEYSPLDLRAGVAFLEFSVELFKSDNDYAKRTMDKIEELRKILRVEFRECASDIRKIERAKQFVRESKYSIAMSNGWKSVSPTEKQRVHLANQMSLLRAF